MKIAVMMRAIDQDSGFQAFMKGLIESMLQIDRENSYLLLYHTNKFMGRFCNVKNVKEVLLSAPHKLVWDQVMVPYWAWKERADIILNPKFSIPLISHCPVVMGLQEPAWWAWPEHYEWLDVRYMKTMLPLYCRKAALFLPWSNFTVDENRKYLKLPFNNAIVTYPAPNKYFRRIEDAPVLEDFRAKYKLPDRFVLNVTRVDHPGLETSTSWHPGKNVETALHAFAVARKCVPHKLVIAGRRVREYLSQTGWKENDFEDVHFIGFVPHEEMPKLYSLAELFVISSFYESYAFTLVEAMTCGCPVVASQTGACPEIAAGAALHADPYDAADFAGKMISVLINHQRREELKKKSLERAAFFSWERTARLTLEGLKQVVTKRASRQVNGLLRNPKESQSYHNRPETSAPAATRMVAYQ